MAYTHHDVQLAEAKIKEQLPHVFIERSDRGYGLSIYTPQMGHSVVFQRAGIGGEVRANLDEVIESYRPKKPEPAGDAA